MQLQLLDRIDGMPNAGGDGFQTDKLFAPTGLAVSGATRAITNSIDRIILDANDESFILTTVVPPDYDQVADELGVGVGVLYVSGTSLTLGVDVVSKIPAKAAAAVVTPASTSPRLTVTGAAQNGFHLFKITGARLKAGDVISIEFDARNVTGSAVVHITGATLRYRSGLAVQIGRGE